MDAVLLALLALGPAGFLLVIVFWLVSHPDTAQKWGEIFYAIGSKIYRRWDRRAVQHGLQFRIDRFAQELATQTGRPKPHPVKVEWTDASEEQRHFFDENRLVLRMHEHVRQDRNLVTGSLLIVSETMAKRAKRFLSITQARASDLYAVDKVLSQSPNARELFHEEVMGPETDKSPNLRKLIQAFGRMDGANMFFPVFIRELNHLGAKFGVAPNDERLITDVSRLVEFLVEFAERAVGDEGDLLLVGRELKCGIMIVARRKKVATGEVGPYLHHADEAAKRGVETLYLVGSADSTNAEFLRAVASGCCDGGAWREVDERTYRSTIHWRQPDGRLEPERVTTRMIVLRRSHLVEVGTYDPVLSNELHVPTD